MACTRSAHSHKKQRGALEQHFLSVESRDHLTFLGRKKINPSLVLLQHYHSATTKLKISLSRWTICFPPILFSSFCGQLNPQKLWIFFFFSSSATVHRSLIALQTTAFSGSTNCRTLAECENQSMSCGITTGKYSGSLSWRIQANSYNTPDILEGDKTEALPLQTHWQGSSLYL